jgi:hypothetical protein
MQPLDAPLSRPALLAPIPRLPGRADRPSIVLRCNSSGCPDRLPPVTKRSHLHRPLFDETNPIAPPRAKLIRSLARAHRMAHRTAHRPLSPPLPRRLDPLLRVTKRSHFPGSLDCRNESGPDSAIGSPREVCGDSSSSIEAHSVAHRTARQPRIGRLLPAPTLPDSACVLDETKPFPSPLDSRNKPFSCGRFRLEKAPPSGRTRRRAEAGPPLLDRSALQCLTPCKMPPSRLGRADPDAEPWPRATVPRLCRFRPLPSPSYTV